jgi:hypothetical protein
MFYYGLEYPVVGKLILEEKKSEFLIKCLAFVVLLY